MRFIWHEALWLLLAVPVLVGAYEWMVRRAARSQGKMGTHTFSYFPAARPGGGT